MRRRVLGLLIACCFVAGPALTHADTPPKAGSERYQFRKAHDPYGIGKFYLDREIAQVMGHQGAGWLERPEREREEQPNKVMQVLKLRRGAAVADIGAGTGYFTFRLSKAVGEKGAVYAVEIQQEMLDIIKKKYLADRTIPANIKLVLGKEDDPKLPDGALDLILMVDVYHEFAYPYEMTQHLVKALKPGGRLVFVEYRKEDPSVNILLVHKMLEKQVKREMAEFPLRWVQTSEVLPTQHIIIFEKKADKAKKN
jgi:SAM-dependent methyltransferase